MINDEVASGFEQKIDICNSLNIPNMEISDEFDGVKITKLSGGEVENLRNLLIINNKKIVLLSCSVPVNDRKYYEEVFRKANLLNVENIKVQLGDNCDNEDEIVDMLASLGKMGKAYGISVLCENRSNSFMSTDNNISKIFKRLPGEYTGFIFNPLEFAKMKRHPFLNEFYNSKLKGKVRFLRINDGLFSDGSPTLPGEGNAEIKEMTSALLARGFKGYFSFVPYLNEMDLNKFKKIIARYKKILMEL